jgi:hypothetical protein
MCETQVILISQLHFCFVYAIIELLFELPTRLILPFSLASEAGPFKISLSGVTLL